MIRGLIHSVCTAAMLSCLMTLLPCAAVAQQTTGRIEGYIHDEDGRPFAGAALTVRGPDLLVRRSLTSRSDGYFVFETLPVGTYELRIATEGRAETVLTGIEVHLGRTTSVGFCAVGPTISRMETMIVTAEPLGVDPEETAVGGRLGAEEFGSLPVDRSYRGLVALLPHVQESFLGDDLNFGGGTGNENKWFIDGADVTDPQFGNGGIELPYNFVRALQVRVGGYQAEYRGAMGGVVDVVTRRGSNTVRSEAFGFFLNDQTAGTPRLGLQDPDVGGFTRWDVGAGLSGPLVKDRLWYFAAYNPAFDDQETDVAGYGPMELEKTTHRFAARLDWRADDNNDLTLSVVGDPGRMEGGPNGYLSGYGTPSSYANPDPLLTVEERGAVATTLQGFHYLGDTTLLESSVSYVWTQNDWYAATDRGAEEILYYDHEADEISGGMRGPVYTTGHDFTAGAKGTWQLGSHGLKAGAEYRQYAIDLDEDGAVLERYYDPDADEEVYFLSDWRYLGSTKNRTPAAFVQDSWRLGDRWRLNLGLRWSGQYVLDSNGDTAIEIADQWQPRLGATYLVGARQRGKLFGSLGRYYQDLSLYAPSVILLEDSSYLVTMYDHDPREDPANGAVVYAGDENLIDDLRGQHYDEATLGYEHQLDAYGSLGVRGIYRELREAIEDTWSDELEAYVLGNPGRGNMSEYPRPSRIYRALEFTYRLGDAEHGNLLASYVLSQNRGNMSGIFATDYGGGTPNLGPQWDLLESTVNGHGLLPNDRTHVLKLAGSWHTRYGMTLGGRLSWASGTPLNEFGAAYGYPSYHTFVVPRGSAGRTPEIWDLSLRFTHDLGYWFDQAEGARILLDLLHVGSPREVTNVDQRHYQLQDDDGNQILPNPTYGRATAYQPPFAVRLGAQILF